MRTAESRLAALEKCMIEHQEMLVRGVRLTDNIVRWIGVEFDSPEVTGPDCPDVRDEYRGRR